MDRVVAFLDEYREGNSCFSSCDIVPSRAVLSLAVAVLNDLFLNRRIDLLDDVLGRTCGVITLDEIYAEIDYCLDLFRGLYTLSKCKDIVIV